MKLSMAWTALRTWVTGEFELSPSQEQARRSLEEQLLAKEPRVVVLEGPRGVGKTALAGYFAQFNADFFQGGVAAVIGGDEIVTAATAELQRGTPSLVLVDEADRARSLGAQLATLRAELPESRVVLVSQEAIDLPGAVDVRIVVEPYSADDLHSRLGLEVTPAEAEQLQAWLHDRTLTPRTLVEALAEGVLSRENLGRDVETYDAAVILAADGRPASEGERHRIELQVRDASERVFEAVRETPDLLQALTPREFEEVVAEHFHRRGYEVELTASSRDGGKDVYVARTDELGSFLYIVECKAYNPTNPVGVRFVRHLYGVVQHERATAGVLATTSHFTRAAKKFQQDVQFQLSLHAFEQVKQWLAAE